MSNPLGNWIDLSAVSNLYIQTYVKGFVDMSGGNLILRNNSIYVNSGDLSLGGRLLTIGDASLGGNLYVGKKLTVNGDVSMNGNLVVYGNLMVQTASNTNIINTTVNNYQLVVTDDISLNGQLLVSNDVSFGGNLIMIGTGTTGRLGIGKSNPLYPLDISGSMNISNPSATATYNNVYGKVAPTTSYPSTISPNTTNATGSTWSNNNVTWTSSASSVLGTTTPTYYAFDATNTTNYTSVGGTTYSPTAGAYIGNIVTTNIIGPSGPATPLSLSGEWLQIQSSIPLTMNSYQLVTPNAAPQLPSRYRIAGSTDGNTWYIIQDCSFLVSPGSTGNTLLNGTAPISTTTSLVPISIGSTTLNITNQSSYSTQPYTYFRMITNAIFAGANAFSLCEWLINFTLPTVSGPSNAIMYMDASNISQVDISGSLGLINSNPTCTVTPCIASPSTNYWTNNNILWTASGSSFNATYPPYTAFRSPSSFVGTSSYPWLAGAVGTYITAAGTYTGSVSTNVVSSTAITGEWIQIQSSVPVYLNGYTLGTQFSVTSDTPGSYTILGSNDGTNWYTMHTTTGFTAWPGNLSSISSASTVSQVTAFYPVFGATTGTFNKNQIQQGAYQTSAYTYFRFVIKTIIGTNNFGANGGNGTARFFWSPVFEPASSSVSLALDAGQPNQLNIGGSMSIAGSVGIGSNIDLTNSTPLALNTTLKQIGTLSQIGSSGVVTNSVSHGIGQSGVIIVLAQTPSLPSGVWLLTFSLIASIPGANVAGSYNSNGTTYAFSTSNTSIVNQWNNFSYSGITTQLNSNNLPVTATATLPFTHTTPTVYYVLVNRGDMYSNATTGTISLSYTRIA